MATRGSALAARRIPALVTGALVLAAVALGVVLRVSVVGRGSLWLDELWTADAISGSARSMVGNALADQSPPLWTVLSYAWGSAVGVRATALRSLAVLASLLAIVAPLIGAARMPRLRQPLLVMAALLSLSVLVVEYAVEFRGYALLIALACAATVVWAGLVTASLPATRRSTLLFVCLGAGAGLVHYYGNVAYVSLLLVLVAHWRTNRVAAWRFLLGAGAISLVPVLGWYLLSLPYTAGTAVAGAPRPGVLDSWLEVSLAPLTRVVPDLPLGGLGSWLVGAAAVLLAAAAIRDASRPDGGEADREASVPTTALGRHAMVAAVLGVAIAWLLSVALPPSMNTRNLSALLPTVFLALGCAVTASRHDRVRWVGAALAVAMWCGAALWLLGSRGVAEWVPPWHRSAGYRDTVAVLRASQAASQPPTLVGLQQPWQWHGDWDAAFRAYPGTTTASASELPVVWVDGSADQQLGQLAPGDLVVFGASDDQRTDALAAWAERTHGQCVRTRNGSSGYGNVTVITCAAGP